MGREDGGGTDTRGLTRLPFSTLALASPDSPAHSSSGRHASRSPCQSLRACRQSQSRDIFLDRPRVGLYTVKLKALVAGLPWAVTFIKGFGLEDRIYIYGGAGPGWMKGGGGVVKRGT